MCRAGVSETVLRASYECFRKDGFTGVAAIVKCTDFRDVGVLGEIGIPRAARALIAEAISSPPPPQPYTVTSKASEYKYPFLEISLQDVRGATESSSRTRIMHARLHTADINLRTGEHEVIEVKVKVASSAYYEHSVTDLEREYRTLRSLCNHYPHLFVKVFDLFRGDGVKVLDGCPLFPEDAIFMAMEEGESNLSQYLAEKVRDYPTRLHVAYRAIEIVEAVHDQHLVVMDFKPANIIRLVQRGEVMFKAIDFDGCKSKGADVSDLDVVATPYFAPP